MAGVVRCLPMCRLARLTMLVAVSALNGLILLGLCFFGVLGLRGRLSDTSDSENFWEGVAFFTMALVALAWSVACFAVLKPRRGRPSGLCRSCGYDLRASPERCPECGTFKSRQRT